MFLHQTHQEPHSADHHQDCCKACYNGRTGLDFLGNNVNVALASTLHVKITCCDGLALCELLLCLLTSIHQSGRGTLLMDHASTGALCKHADHAGNKSRRCPQGRLKALHLQAPIGFDGPIVLAVVRGFIVIWMRKAPSCEADSVRIGLSPTDGAPRLRDWSCTQQIGFSWLERQIKSQCL